MKVIKRNGQEQDFSLDKIYRAIRNANNNKELVPEDSKMTDAQIDSVVNAVMKKLDGFNSVSVDDVHLFIEKSLYGKNRDVVARSYVIGREKKRLNKKFTENEEKALALISGNSAELRGDNANKNIDNNAAISDYLAGILTKSLGEKLLPKDIWKAHKEGIIHFHDSDYSPLRPMHNCFSGEQKFLTSKGFCKFSDFADGDIVVVKDKDGVDREATVHTFGVQSLQEVVLTAGEKYYKVVCTPNHRWILEDGTVTETISVNDKLYVGPQTEDGVWTVDSIKPYNDGTPEEVYCVTEPVTHTFTLEYGIITGNCDLIDLEDMFKNTFVMGNTLIEPNDETPFRTSTTLSSQCHSLISSGQFGGQTISWSALLPYVGITRNVIQKELISDWQKIGIIKEVSIDGYLSELYSKYGDSLDIYKDECIYNDQYIVKFNDEHSLKLTTIPYKTFSELVEEKLNDDIYEGVKTYQYQVLCHATSNGQTPFVSNNINLREAETQQELDDMALLIEHIIRRRMKGVQDPSGVYVSPLFPKLLYWTCDGLNVKPEDPYYYLTELAAECESIRMQPDIMSEKQTRKIKNGQVIPTMGCRSLLPALWEEYTYPIDTEFFWTDGNERGEYPYGQFFDKKSFKDVPNGTYETPDVTKYTYEDGYSFYTPYVINFRGNTGWLVEKTDDHVVIRQPKVYGRYNLGVVTINLPHVALTARSTKKTDESGNEVELTKEERIAEFWKILDERLELVRKALECRGQYVERIKGKNSPILWMYGALGRIGAEDTVGEFIKQHPDRHTISVGYVGMYETCRALIDESNTSEEGQKLCIDILKYMNQKCKDWKKIGSYSGRETVIKGDEEFELD